MLGAALWLTGCGATVDYTRLEVSVAPLTSQVLTLGVCDLRPDGPAHLGVKRSTAYLPSEVVTASGAPLADDLGSGLAVALQAAGASPNLVSLPRDEAKARDRLLEETRGEFSSTPDPQRALLVVLRAFESDGYFGSVTLRLDLSAFLLDTAGRVRASASLSAEREGEYAGSAGYAATCVRLAGEALGELLRGPLAEFAGAPPPRGAPGAPPVTPGSPQAPPPSAQPSAATCAACGRAREPEWRVCPFCGRPFAERR